MPEVVYHQNILMPVGKPVRRHHFLDHMLCRDYRDFRLQVCRETAAVSGIQIVNKRPDGIQHRGFAVAALSGQQNTEFVRGGSEDSGYVENLSFRVFIMHKCPVAPPYFLNIAGHKEQSNVFNRQVYPKRFLWKVLLLLELAHQLLVGYQFRLCHLLSLSVWNGCYCLAFVGYQISYGAS